MNKSAIKIVKRKNVAEKTEAVRNAVKVASNAQHKIVNVVKGWICERSVNSRTEKVFSDNKILSWKIMPKTIEETFG